MQQVAVDCAAWIKATQFVPLDCAAWTDLLHRLTPMRFLVGNILPNSPLSTNKTTQTVINKQTNARQLPPYQSNRSTKKLTQDSPSYLTWRPWSKDQDSLSRTLFRKATPTRISFLFVLSNYSVHFYLAGANSSK